MDNLVNSHFENLFSEDFEQRADSIKFLISYRDENSYKKLMDLLLSEDAIARNAAIEILSGIGFDIINNIIENTKNEEPNQRIYSANILGEIKSPKALDSLFVLLEDPEINVRFASAEAIGKIGSKEATMPLLHYLYARQDDPWEQFPLILTLGQLNDERAVIPLLQLTDNDMLKQPVIQAISTIADEHALSYIIDLMVVSDDEILEHMSILAIKNIRDKVIKYKSGQESFNFVVKKCFDNLNQAQMLRMSGILNKNIKNDDFSIKICSSVLMGFISTEESLITLLDAYSDDLSYEIKESLINIAKNNPEIILNYLSKTENSYQDLLISVLGRLEIKQARHIFIEKLSHSQHEIKIQAVRAILKLGDDNDLEHIFKMLDDPSNDIKNIIIESINIFDHNKIIKMLKSSKIDELTKIKIILNLEVNIEEVLKFYNSDDYKIRKSVAEILKKYPKNDAEKEIIDLLNDENTLVREAAIRSIEYRKDDISQYFDRLTKDNSDWVRYYLAKSLAYHNITENMIKTLEYLLNDKVPFVRIAAIESIGNIKNNLLDLNKYKLLFEKLSNQLIDLSTNEDPDISQAAIIAFSNINFHPEEFYNILKEQFDNKDWIIRKSVAYALKMSTDINISYKLLNEMLENEEEVLVLKEILTSLSDLYEKVDYKEEIIRLLISYTMDDDLRDDVINILSSMDKSIIPILQGIFEDSESDIKLNIISVISNFDDEKSLQMLIKLSSNDSSAKIRKHAVLSLSNFKSQQRALWAIMWAANHDLDTLVNQTAKSLLVS